ncbi:beta-alanyl-bioamine nonribosomal peptide synthetase ebony [Culicoides brevitarsis]|uniref:beta-alanyl-bioamine nonribosomal peptide synthetase ebony n=1 Tax=Culicoides brevitarsis TaxID=469753 RepID=UPI00307B2FB8
MGSLPQLSISKGAQRLLAPRLLHKIFEENVDASYGANTALVFDDISEGTRNISYNLLNSRTNRLAHGIINQVTDIDKSAPNQDGDWVIAVCMPPSDNLVAALLAIWKAGAAYLPLDVTFPANRINHILTEARPVLVIYDESYKATENFKGTSSVSFQQLLEDSQDCSNANLAPKDTLGGELYDLAIILYTSGSTGVPKGVRIPHQVILNRLQWQWQKFPYSKTEKNCVFKTALTFVDSVSEIWGPLLNGLTLIVITKDVTKDPERLVAALEKYKIERLVLVPTLLRSLLLYLPLQNDKNLLKSLKIWVCSGEPLSLALAKEFYDFFEQGQHILCNFYGSTEVMGDVTYFVCESKKQLEALEKVPIGYPVDNTVIYLLDGDFRPVKSETVGELFVAGMNLAQGYVNGRDPEKFIENPLAIDAKYSRLYRTGDFASFSKGVIYYEGRTDSQIKIRGHRVDLSEVEKNILSLNGIEKAVVLCYHAGEIDQALLAFVTLEEGQNMTGMQIESNLMEILAQYMIPQVIVLDSIPLLVNGKVDRQSLLKMYENTNNNDDAAVEIDYDYSDIPESQLPTAKVLFETIGSVIGRSTRTSISIRSNFYELGGNSLNSIFTVTELRNKGFHVSITNFIAAKNLGEILEKLCSVESVNGNSGNIDLKVDCDMKLEAVPLALEHKDDTIDIITTSFFEKADLEQWLKPMILYTDYADILNAIWDVLVEKDLSFVVKDVKTDRIVGVSLNFDARDEPEVPVESKLIIVFEFLEFLEGPIRDGKLPEGLNQILHSFMMGTKSDLNAQENIALMHFMESEVLKLAERKNFAGIFTTNTSPLTQQLGSSVYGYETLHDYPVNKYVYHDGSRPFGAAPDSQRAICHWKDIRK